MSQHIDAPADAPASAAPNQVRGAAAVAVVQALALVAVGVWLLAKTFAGSPDSVARALLDAGFALLGALTLGACARGLIRLNSSARTPAVVLELLAIPVSYSLAFQAHRVLYGGPILLSALAVLYLLATPAARAALDRRAD